MPGQRLTIRVNHAAANPARRRGERRVGAPSFDNHRIARETWLRPDHCIRRHHQADAARNPQRLVDLVHTVAELQRAASAVRQRSDPLGQFGVPGDIRCHRHPVAEHSCQNSPIEILPRHHDVFDHMAN